MFPTFVCFGERGRVTTPNMWLQEFSAIRIAWKTFPLLYESLNVYFTPVTVLILRTFDKLEQVQSYQEQLTLVYSLAHKRSSKIVWGDNF